MNTPFNNINCNVDLLFKEYDICRKEALQLETNIWKTAAIFSIGSGVGLTYFLKEYLIFKGNANQIGLVVFLFGSFSIIVSLVWWRIVKRWWSIQHIKYERMRELEKLLGFRQCSMVCERDCEAMEHIKSYRFIYVIRYKKMPKKTISKRSIDISRIKNYEHRGIQPAISLLLWSNFVLWLSLYLFSCGAIQFYYGRHISEYIFPILIILIVSLYYFWRRP
jgi:hypothetical protein